MCRSSLHDFLVAVPKVELHCHLEGTLPPSLLLELASRNKIALPDDEAFSSVEKLSARYDRFSSLDDFLHYYSIGMSCLVQQGDFEDLAWNYFLKAKSDNVVHAEVFFDPQAHTSRGIDLATVVTGFENACRQAQESLDISSLLIPCFLRHMPLDSSEQLWETLAPCWGQGRMVGVGLSGSEKAHPPRQWSKFYRDAHAKDIRRTAHAGEEGPADFIRQAVQDLQVQRIDHGIRLADDDDLLKTIADRELLLTVCPLSNLKLRCVKRIGELPIRRFLDAGVRFCLNSDDPAYFKSYILDNFCAVQEAFDLSLEEWISISRAGIEGSWCPEERKATVSQKLDEVVSSSKTQ